MVKQYRKAMINDDTKIVRFLNLYGAQKSIGSLEHGDINCTFHFGLLNHYKILETNAGDANEGSISVALGNGVVGTDATSHNALVSCWSIWDGNDNPWFSFSESSFTKNTENICAIVSTIGKVRSIFHETVEINKLLLGDYFKSIVFYFRDEPVIYYPRKTGIDQSYWQEITDENKYGLEARTNHCIFHKRDSHQNGQRYDVECEYRFAMILGNRDFIACNREIAINAEDAVLRDYPLILLGGNHYIEKVYLRTTQPQIVTACRSTGTELISHTENIVV